MDQLKDFAKRLLSRKFLLAIVGAVLAFVMAGEDGVITGQEQALIIAPLLSFIGAEGLADALRASGSINAIGKKK